MAKGNKLTSKVNAAPVAVAEDMKWRAESALRTLTEADRIRRDKSLMTRVKKEARIQAKALEKVCSPKPNKASGR